MHMTSCEKSPVRASGTLQTSIYTIDSYAYEEMWSTPVKGGTFDVEDRIRATIRDQEWATYVSI